MGRASQEQISAPDVRSIFVVYRLAQIIRAFGLSNVIICMNRSSADEQSQRHKNQADIPKRNDHLGEVKDNDADERYGAQQRGVAAISAAQQPNRKQQFIQGDAFDGGSRSNEARHKMRYIADPFQRVLERGYAGVGKNKGETGAE